MEIYLPEPRAIGVKIMEKEIDYSYTEEIVCPYCGYEFADSWGCGTFKRDGDEEEFTCHDCEKEFKVTLNAEYSYSSEKLESK